MSGFSTRFIQLCRYVPALFLVYIVVLQLQIGNSDTDLMNRYGVYLSDQNFVRDFISAKEFCYDYEWSIFELILTVYIVVIQLSVVPLITHNTVFIFCTELRNKFKDSP